ncbi:lipase family protein [bacterium]|nr:lipase family protein [bacterium]MBU1993630.1 lipase family protein [bacterium]
MFRYITKGSISFIMLLSLIFFSGCGDTENTGANIVGNNIVSAEIIDDINTSVMLSVIKASINPAATNAFGYKAVKIHYNTSNQEGKSVTASGLLVIPSASDAYKQYLASLGKAYSISMICDNHGTIFTDAEAPTNVEVTNGMPDYSVAVLMSGYAGFAAILPDYVGYGNSDSENHPYILKNASAQSSLDMIKASVRYMTDNNILFNGQLFISGYSEGGHTAMALAKEIQENHSSEFALKGVAPMAGPHDVEGLGNIEINATRTMLYPAFLAYLADSYSQAYSDVVLSDLVNETNTTMFHSLFDGSKSNVEIHAALGLTINYGFAAYNANVLFEDSFITDYQNNVNNSFRVRLAQNSVNNWTPNVRMNLIHCAEDEIIPFSMSQGAYDNFIANGVSSSNVTLTSIPTIALAQQVDSTHPFVHANCGNEAYGAAVTWFDSIRQGN